MAFLGADGKQTRFADFNRVAAWLERGAPGAKSEPSAEAHATRGRVARSVGVMLAVSEPARGARRSRRRVGTGAAVGVRLRRPARRCAPRRRRGQRRGPDAGCAMRSRCSAAPAYPTVHALAVSRRRTTAAIDVLGAGVARGRARWRRADRARSRMAGREQVTSELSRKAASTRRCARSPATSRAAPRSTSGRRRRRAGPQPDPTRSPTRAARQRRPTIAKRDKACRAGSSTPRR